VILRFAGIYGPGRVLRKASLLKGEPVPGDGERFVNLIHVDDGVRAVLAAEANAEPGETYLIADDAPPTRRELFTRTAKLIGAPVPTFDGGGGVEANRRVSNAKAKQRLGFQPLYPSIAEGLPASV
jgi:nucleoside-diphosphate-sugar epimerase